MIEIMAQVKIISKFALIYLCTYKKMYVTVFEIFEIVESYGLRKHGNFLGKHLYWNPYFNKVLGWRATSLTPLPS